MYPKINAHYEEILAALDSARMMKTTEELLKLEVGQTFSSYHASARRTFEILQEMGIPNAEKITYAANGRDSYQDKQTPIGWDATVGKVIIAAVALLMLPVIILCMLPSVMFGGFDEAYAPDDPVYYRCKCAQ